MADKHNLLYLFDRPQEPIFMAKGTDDTIFQVPQHFLTDRYRPIGTQLASRFGESASNRIPVRDMSPPDLGEITTLGKHDNFSLFIPMHSRLAGRLIEIFMNCKDIDELQSCAAFCRDRVNPLLFNYALNVSILHRDDTSELDVPSFVHFFPDKFVDSKVFARAREEATIVPTQQRSPIEIPIDYTASDLETEHRIAYFREDVGINLHHWHWHLVYPFDGPRELVNKNRRGELFYYMHQQIQARYNFERLCNKLKRVARFNDWRAPIEEAYFPKLDNLVASRAWPARMANQTLSDLNRPADQIALDLDDMYRWRDRIFDAIHAGYATDERGNRVELTENEGIDILGNMVDSSILSPNRAFYGNMHNMGHVILSFVHDPDHRHLESFGVIGDNSTSMRDPVFYRWHAFIDSVFQEHKATLPRYTVERLNYPGVTVSDVTITSQGASNNEFNTFWQQSDLDLSRGMDFQPRGSVLIRFTHLQYHPFNYNITVNNTGDARQGTCRIFLAPRFDERGNPWLFSDQRLMFVELDRFTVNLTRGQNRITRKSSDSSLTIPFERTFRDLEVGRPTGGDALERFNYCGCGWPQHMLLPRGSPEGYPCHLFVMISNYADDRIEQSVEGSCNDSEIFCGIKDKLYPDRRSMGYPFDRMPRPGVNTLQEFLTPNMLVRDVTIKYTNRTVRARSQNN